MNRIAAAPSCRDRALVLAAHGSRRQPAANALVEAHAAALRRWGLFREVAAAFHQGQPAFAQVLDGLVSTAVTVVPFMTSDGYYCDTVIPRELAKNRRFPEVELDYTLPVGLHPDLHLRVLKRVEGLATAHNLDPGATAVAVVGHGTRRHPRSRGATLTLAQALRAGGRFAQVLPFFLDDEPPVEEIPRAFSGSPCVVVPFLMGGSVHATSDLPSRLGLVVSEDGDRDPRLVVDQAVGADPALARIIADLAAAGDRSSPEASV